MISFDPIFNQPILKGIKTCTSRRRDESWAVGETHFCFNPSKNVPFASVKIIEVIDQRLLLISDDQAIAEGFKSRIEFFAWWCLKYGPITHLDVINLYYFRLATAITEECES